MDERYVSHTGRQIVVANTISLVAGFWNKVARVDRILKGSERVHRGYGSLKAKRSKVQSPEFDCLHWMKQQNEDVEEFG